MNKKIVLSLLIVVSIFSVFAVGFHTADEILPGTFTGNYVFNGNTEIICPSGYTSVKTIGPNSRQIGCIETAEHGSGTWNDAVQNCLSNDARLPFAQEWVIAAMNYALTDEIDDWEWVGDLASSPDRKGLVGNGAVYTSDCSLYSATFAYRCFIAK